MDYNSSIPDIYNHSLSTSNDFTIHKHIYNLKPNEKIYIKCLRKDLFLYFETEHNNMYIDDTKIWNKRIQFNSNILYDYLLYNQSDYSGILIISVVCCNKYINKITLNESTSYNIEKLNKIYNKNISMFSVYSGIDIRYKIFLQSYNEISDKIVKIQIFNIIIYYKTNFISKNMSYSYELILCGIKNNFTNEYLYIDITFSNLQEIYIKYLIMFKDLKNFLQKNIDYINQNNVYIPEDFLDPDGWNYNIFYSVDMEDFIKKYKIFNYDAYKIYMSN